MKTKKKTQQKKQKVPVEVLQKIRQQKLLLFVILFALIGSFFVWRSFAGTAGHPPQCVSIANLGKSSSRSTPKCKSLGKTGGVTYWFDSSIPQKRIHVTRIDLNNKQLLLRASQFDERGQTPSEFARATNSLAAINGDFFYKNNNYITNGLAIGNAMQWPFTKDKKTTSFLACTIYNECFIDNHNTEVQLDPKQYVTVVGGSEILLTPQFQWHLKPGEPGCGSKEHTCSAQHPRTAVGLSHDKRVMWWVVVEGRHKHISGLSLYDLTKTLKKLGAAWAINLDGGGSSGMVINGQLANSRPSDEPSERKVGNSIGVIELPVPK